MSLNPSRTMAQHVSHKVATIAPRPGPAVVVSAGRMQRTVKVRQVKELWNQHLRKSFFTNHNFLVHDPNSSLIEGDVITTTPERHSKHVKHTVSGIIAPFGKPVEDRPPLHSAEQRAEILDAKRKAKVQRRAARGTKSAIDEARERGWEVQTAATGGWGAVYKEAEKAGGVSRAESPKDSMNRSVLPGGKHRFGGKGEGGINKEASFGAERTRARTEKAREHEAEREDAESQPTEEVAKEHLEGKR